MKVLALALLAFVVQGAALALLVALAQPLLQRVAASIRYALLLACLASAPVMVVVTVFALVPPGATPPSASVTAGWGWAEALVACWALGVAMGVTRAGHSLRQTLRLRATGLPLRDWQARTRALARSFGIERAVLVVESPAVLAPLLVGVLRPMVMLPLGLATHMPTASLEAVIAHELAHVRRHDVLARAFVRAVEILLFFHPVVWWLSSQLAHAREEACDDEVVDRLADPMTYARALTDLEAHRTTTLALAASSTDGDLMHRIRHILDRSSPRRSRRVAGGAMIAATAALGLTVALAAAPAQTHASAPEPAELSIAWLPETVADFEPEILAAARRHDVDPELVAIIVLLESYGNPTVRSPAGARGLMQVMPRTSDAIAHARGLADHRHEKLDDPAYNLDLGVWYLAQQIERFAEVTDDPDEVVAWAAAAYNGGPDRAEQAWRGTAELSEETMGYQARVATLWAERDRPSSTLVEPGAD